MIAARVSPLLLAVGAVAFASALIATFWPTQLWSMSATLTCFLLPGLAVRPFFPPAERRGVLGVAVLVLSSFCVLVPVASIVYLIRWPFTIGVFASVSIGLSALVSGYIAYRKRQGV